MSINYIKNYVWTILYFNFCNLKNYLMCKYWKNTIYADLEILFTRIM